MDRQFHCHVQVSGSSCALDGEPLVGCDVGVEACAPDVVLGEAAVVAGVALTPDPAPGAADATAAATFTCVTAPSSPGLPIRTLTLTLFGDACTAAAGVVAVEGVVAIPAAVSGELGVVSGWVGS